MPFIFVLELFFSLNVVDEDNYFFAVAKREESVPPSEG